VTHLFEFANRISREETLTSLTLRAERLPDGTRSYRVLEGAPLATSFGPDLLRQMGADAGLEVSGA
jgi:hypothetical protein